MGDSGEVASCFIHDGKLAPASASPTTAEAAAAVPAEQKTENLQTIPAPAAPPAGAGGEVQGGRGAGAGVRDDSTSARRDPQRMTGMTQRDMVVIDSLWRPTTNKRRKRRTLRRRDRCRRPMIQRSSAKQRMERITQPKT